MTAPEYRAVMDELGVEERPKGGIYLHLTTPTFDRFVERRLAPANEAIGLDRATDIKVAPLHTSSLRDAKSSP